MNIAIEKIVKIFDKKAMQIDKMKKSESFSDDDLY